jgi:nitroimidazol reductase NimA-like FMN-containing flavoprotein (pyridoxamine 5'-phosphate oxidase superfamily)
LKLLFKQEESIMFRKMRRIKREISLEEAKDLLRNNKRAAFSVNGDDGYPYTVPINFYYDEKENRIYFHSAKNGHKIDAIKENDKVCFTTWNDGYLEEGDWAYYVSSCVVFGRARLIEDDKITEEKVRTFALKYYPTAEEAEDEIAKDIKGVQLAAIDIEHISGKRVHEK